MLRHKTTAIALLVSALVLGGCSHASSAVTVPAGAQIGVVTTGNESDLQVFDAATGRQMERLCLRSAAYTLAADRDSRTFVTAQAGGLDLETDRALGLFVPGKDRRVRYVELPSVNPFQVEAVSGIAYAVHGTVVTGGLWMTAVDIARGAVIATGTAPDGAGRITRAAGRLWMPYFRLDHYSSGRRPTRLGVVDPGSLETSMVANQGFDDLGIVTDDAGSTSTVLYAGSDRRVGGTAAIRRLRVFDGAVVESAPVPAVHWAAEAVATGDGFIALLDNEGTEQLPQGAGVVVLDARSLRFARRIPLGRGPLAIQAWRDLVLVADGPRATLTAYSATDGRVRWRARLARRTTVCVAMAILGPP